MRKKPVHGDFEAFSSRWPKYAARVMVILCLALYRPVSLPASPLDSWSNRASGISSQLSDIAYGGTRFVAVGDGGKILTSEDGITWTMRDSGTSDGLSGVAYAGGLFVIGVNSWVSPGFLLISQDGVSWTRSNSGVNGALSGLAYGNGNFVAVGGRGNITSSPDGTNWTQRSSGTGNFLFEVAYGKGLFVAVGGYGSSATILTSQDGATWAAQTAGLSEVLNGVTFGDGLFAAVGSSGDVATSSDGTNWTARAVVSSQTFTSLRFAQSTFVAVGVKVTYVYPQGFQYAGFLMTSPDALTWSARLSGLPDALNGVTFGAGSFVAVGGSGMILQSGYFGPPKLSTGSFSPASGFTIGLTGETGRTYRLQAVTDAHSSNWLDLFAFTLVTNPTNLLDGTATNFSQRFYRVISP